MFWNKKEEYRTTVFGVSVTFANARQLAVALENASGILDQHRKTYNLLLERQNLILSHLKLKYVPETETKEPAKLVDNTVSLVINWGILGNPYAGTTQSVKETPKKRGRPKKK